jgi:hypothetical protein
VLKVGATGLAVALAFLPRQRDPARMAALEAAVLIATSTVTSEPSLNVAVHVNVSPCSIGRSSGQ